jgi:hypothetical protein
VILSTHNYEHLRETESTYLEVDEVTIDSLLSMWVSHPVLERNRMHLICAPGSSSTYMIDDTSVYPKQCHNEIEYYSTSLHDQKS